MRGRTTGKIIVGALTVILGLMTVFYIITAEPVNEGANGIRSISYAILALTSATCYRYFED
ncbi:MAG: hypothetical protein ACOC0A_01645 [Planctomycetota bacterium]